MSNKTLTFTVEQLAEALNNVRCLYDLGPELIAEEVFSASAQQPAPVNKSVIRDVFLRNGFTIKEGQTDLKPYVYAAAEELLSLDGKALAAAPAAPVAQEPVAWALRRNGALGSWLFNSENQARRFDATSVAGGPGNSEVVALYTAPPAAEQPECVTCSGHGLVGNRLDDGRCTAGTPPSTSGITRCLAG